MDRRAFLAGGLATSGLLAACGGSGGSAGSGTSGVLRVIHPQTLSILDPVFTTAPATKDYAFLTFDQLVAADADQVPQPQMAEGWTVEDDGKRYVFKLRDGLKWHDGEPVRAQDCVPSIRRWAARDSFGQVMMQAVDAMPVIDDRTFEIRLSRPFPLLPNALGKTAGPQCFMMPERMASLDPAEQITESVGSGPFKFLPDEWVAGVKAAWAKNPDYVPRSEPPSGIAGGKVPRVDRVEWSVISDPSTALAALNAGEQDLWDIVPADLAPSLKANPDVKVAIRSPSGGYYMMQFNHLHPPFNNEAIRQAVAMAIDQDAFLQVAQPDPALREPQYGIYALGTEYATEAGADVLKVKSIERARAALQAAGYNGERVVLLASLDSPTTGGLAHVAEDLFKQLGMTVEFVATDFATLSQRRLSHEDVDHGGWSVYLTGWTGNDVLNPVVNPMLRGSGLDGFPGWCTDPELERLRSAWAFSTDPAEQKQLATAVQVQALKTLPYIPLGSFRSQSAYRTSVQGVFPAPVIAYWNLSKA